MGDRPSTSTAHVPSSSPPSPQSSGSSSPAADAEASHPSTASYLSGIWAGLLRHLSLDEDEAEPEPPAMDDVSLRQAPARDNLGPREQALGNGVDAVFHPASRRGSPFRPPPLEPLLLLGFDNTTPASARLLTAAVAEEVRTMVPERLRIADEWHLVYSLEQDGASLGTLYQKCRHYEGRRVGFVLVVRDQEGGIFGGYLSESPRPSPSYLGNGECFLWRVSNLAPSPSLTSDGTPATASDWIRFKAFPYSGLNDCYINCETGFLSLGAGGGHYGLWLDNSLETGHSSRCETFGNEPLSDVGTKFGVLGVELWVVGA